MIKVHNAGHRRNGLSTKSIPNVLSEYNGECELS